MVNDYWQHIIGEFRSKQPELLLLTMFAVFLLFLQQTDYFLPFIRLNILLSTFLIYSAAILVLDMRPQVTVVLGVLALAFSYPLLIVHYSSWADRIALYAFGFFALATVQLVVDLWKEKVL